ncbi:MAG: thioredoxin family protein [Calditrichia bacterium]
MAFLSGKDKEYVENLLQNLPNKVKLVYFSQELNCEYCSDTQQLITELSELSNGNVELEIYNFQIDKEKVEEYNIDKVPAIAVVGEKDYGIRYYGIPAGYEFSSILEDIQTVAKGEPGLSEKSLEMLKEISRPLKLQVFVTPTCPYCPSAVLMAHKIAMVNDNIVADMVEATEFMELSQKYHVQGVPRTVIGEHHFVEGAVPEEMFVKGVLEGYLKQLEAEKAAGAN